ncbi:hypothetical protein [Nesterenkonia sp. NBAIMH1]|uniref:hypothetical protein n=1 Tax=Nesterenkonia sp. NBAIMH1 TaxID=2600320 RepID=UPI0011B3BF94|nr:hypothetical protein [Nesterenkonia sp. NBAIMH1]
MSPERRASQAQWEEYLRRVETWAQHVLNPTFDRDALDAPSPEPPAQPSTALPPEFAERALDASLALERASQQARAAQAEIGRSITSLRRAPTHPDETDQARYLDTSG